MTCANNTKSFWKQLNNEAGRRPGDQGATEPLSPEQLSSPTQCSKHTHNYTLHGRGVRTVKGRETGMNPEPPSPTGHAHCPRPLALHAQSFHFLVTETFFYFSKLIRPRLSTFSSQWWGKVGGGSPVPLLSLLFPITYLACCSGMKTSWPTHSQSGGHLDGQFSGQEPAHGSFWEPGGPSPSRVAGSRRGPPRGEGRSSQGKLSSARGSGLCSHMDRRLKPQGWIGRPHCSKNPGMSRSQQ